MNKPTESVPVEFLAMHSQITDCEIKGQTGLAEALSTMLNRMIAEYRQGQAMRNATKQIAA